MSKLDTLAAIATDLTAVLSAEDRYQRLLDALHIAIPYDSAALLRVNENCLVPLAARGLTPDVMGRKFFRKNHPRLDIICGSDGPVAFSEDSTLPDPFDGMLVADALDPKAFTKLPKKYVMAIGSMAGAHIQCDDTMYVKPVKSSIDTLAANETDQYENSGSGR